ncbi:PREDICTED: coiled-coil domain-containing protein 23, partial [Mesitornis unicolor]
RKERPKSREPAARLEKAKQKSAQQELKQRQRAEIYALNRVMTELEQQQFDSFCKQMQPPGILWLPREFTITAFKSCSPPSTSLPPAPQ